MNETLKRALSGAVYIVLLLGCILYSKESFYLLFACFLAIASYEFLKINSLNKFVPTLFSLIIFTVLYYYNFNWIFDFSITLISLITLIYLVIFLFNKESFVFSTSIKYLIYFGYITLPFVILSRIPFNSNILSNDNYRPKIIISIFILIWVNDTFAYLIGKKFGKNKLFPSISPKKTIEGLLGGMFFSIIATFFIIKFVLNAKFNLLKIWIPEAIIISLFSTLGDLIESKFKRIAGVKDSGNIMPGHGGVLDRLDSIIFVVPFIYLFYLILNYVS